MSVGYELVDRTADIGVRLWGPTAEEVFEQAALALFSLVCDPLQIGDLVTVDVELEAEGMDLLLAAWLNELLSIFAASRWVATSSAAASRRRRSRSSRSSVAATPGRASSFWTSEERRPGVGGAQTLPSRAASALEVSTTVR